MAPPVEPALMFRKKREEDGPLAPPARGYDWGWGRKPVAR